MWQSNATDPSRNKLKKGENMAQVYDPVIRGLVDGAHAIKNVRQLEVYLETMAKHGSRKFILAGTVKTGFIVRIVPGETKGVTIMVRPKSAGAEKLEFVGTTDPDSLKLLGWKKFQPYKIIK